MATTKKNKTKISVVKPREKVIRVFRPLRPFEDAELKSTYVVGEKYYVREGNTKLATRVKQWLRDGRIEIVKQEENK